MSSIKKWPIYATKRMVDIIPQLCAMGDRHTVAVNVLFHCFGSNNEMNIIHNRIFKEDYIETLKFIYNDSMWNSVSRATFASSGVREVIFSPFDDRIIHTISPSIHSKQKNYLLSSLEESLRIFSLCNTRAKENIDINGLFASVGAKEFIKVIRILGLQYKLEAEVTAATINDFFDTILESDCDFGRMYALEFSSMLLSYKKTDLYKPFVSGSWCLADLLKNILASESKVALDVFINMVPECLKSQTSDMLKSVDSVTGLLKYPWGYVESQNIRKIETPEESEIISEDIGVTITEPNVIVETVVNLIYVFEYLKRSITPLVPQKDKKAMISVYFEDDVFVTADINMVFIIDLFVKDETYQLTLYKLLCWIWSCPHILKVGHRVMSNIAVLSHMFDKAFVSFSNIIDLNDKRVKRTNKCNGSALQNTISPTERTNEMYGNVEDSDEVTIFFRTSGISKNLNGLLQEFNLPVYVRQRHWSGKVRPICQRRSKYLVNIAKGILVIENTLRNQCWWPSNVCDLDPSYNGPFLRNLESSIEDIASKVQSVEVE